MPATHARRLAAAILADRDARRRFGDYAHAHEIADMDAAYDVQDALTAELTARAGAAIVGHKVGLTSKRMQEMCGVDRPIIAPVLADALYASGTSIRLADIHRAGVECEICVRLAADLPETARDVRDIAPHVEAIHAAFEVIADREADYSALDPHMLAADGGWNAGVVLGEAVAPPADLAALRGRLLIDGREADTGIGADAMGNPLESAACVARHLAARGGRLRGGDIVMTGAIIPTVFPEPGQTLRFELAGIGSVEASFA